MNKQKIIITKGLPGSGKTFFAKEFIKKNPSFKRINKDDLRAMLDDGKWSREKEKFIVQARDDLAKSALSAGFNVIIDDTNLAPKHLEHITQLFTDVDIEVKDFTDVPIETCVERDEKRHPRVGEKVIRQMYLQFLKPIPTMVKHKDGLQHAIICDLDGTLAIFGKDRNPYDRDFTEDNLNGTVAEVLRTYKEQLGNAILLVSGRKDTYREQTEIWLEKYAIEYDKLIMRKGDDSRKDYIVKKEIYDVEIKGKYNVDFVLDDRNQVVELWRDLGLTCFQVADGNF